MEDIDTLITRAEALLCWMDAASAAQQLMDSGIAAELAYLAVRAAETP